jgi:hypothetical protein
VPGAATGEVVLVDDDGGWVWPDQQEWWVPIAPWDGGADGELQRVREVLECWLAEGPDQGVRAGPPG